MGMQNYITHIRSRHEPDNYLSLNKTIHKMGTVLFAIWQHRYYCIRFTKRNKLQTVSVRASAYRNRPYHDRSGFYLIKQNRTQRLLILVW